MFCKKQTWPEIITPQKAKLGPDNNTTTYVYIYIDCEVIRVDKFGLSGFKREAKQVLLFRELIFSLFL